MNDNKRTRTITFAILAAIILAGILLFALFMKPIPELTLNGASSSAKLLHAGL
ncbi:MAG: hypothetical protein IKQ39_03940 [Oscillospiraceae bacterium]|nr:hypothetical protein [Oscillospiraceae bacterium]